MQLRGMLLGRQRLLPPLSGTRRTRHLLPRNQDIVEGGFDDQPSKDDNTYGKKNIWKCLVCELNRHVGNHKHCSKITQLKYKND